ncbi:hybrid-cluster NAD(P)-dependent oxidoreductase [Moritella sp. F3]|uniref:hybrid-cluster NAD(P)-dependent oxidoreductase n=1 Tax=Moritella sp. F3 TaxID=2718882 RepID=UPI0018E1141D|nr:hybrid-cluster NAD(P)-dependent oxidoreductase [Moritella sp. F3]GIC76745.1 hybrid-cluster NAD(P)-dependent oxidoreductase [Moritella sp. F1]GIC80239.1 hybrid-cluster NAD(P)-dependent oxidoreductase [Moritella sp. F3]
MSSSKTPSSTLTPPALKPLKLNSAGLGQSTTGKEKPAPVSSKLQAPKLNFALGGSKSTGSSKLATPKLSFSLGETAVKSVVKTVVKKHLKPTTWSPTTTSLVLVKRELETHDSMSFTFAAADQTLFDFKPGQFVTLAIEIEGKTHYRAYSISSVPQQKQLRLTIKRVPDGLVSNWLADNLTIGDNLSALNIAGQFNSSDCQHKSKLLLVSAGCGITPVMSIAKTLLAQDSDADIEFLHCARDKDNVIFHAEMQTLIAQHNNFKVQLLLENSDGFANFSANDNTTTNSPALAHQTGMVSKDVIQQLYPDLQDRTIFLCGPVGFMKAVENIAQESDFDMANFFQESFTPAADNKLQDNITSGASAASVMLYVPDFAVEKEVAQGSSLLELLENNGVPIIGACRAGVCGSCKCKVTSGEVKSTSSETLTAAEIEQGVVLACSSTVEGDVTVALS